MNNTDQIKQEVLNRLVGRGAWIIRCPKCNWSGYFRVSGANTKEEVVGPASGLRHQFRCTWCGHVW
jgi:hypothetical protein